MRCPQHPTADPTWTCARCGAFFCRQCGVPPLDGNAAECFACVNRAASAFGDEVAGASVVGKALQAAGEGLMMPARQTSVFERLGRRGGLLLLGLASLLGLMGLLLMMAGVSGSFRGLILGLVALFFAVSSAYRGVRVLRRPPPQRGLSTAEIAERLKHPPVVLCLACRLIVSTIPCGQCGRASDCLEVRTEEDARLALAALPEEEP